MHSGGVGLDVPTNAGQRVDVEAGTHVAGHDLSETP
jgi:hypothetical protein